jgi:hypothetical protein
MSIFSPQLGGGRSIPTNLNNLGFVVQDSDGTARFPLSTSTTGAPINVGTTTTAGTTIHVAEPRAQDEVYLWATNTGASNAQLSISFGDSNISTSTNTIVVTVNSKDGLSLVCPGLPVKNTTIYAVGGAAGINIFGFVMRYYPRVGGQTDPSSQSGFNGAQ